MRNFAFGLVAVFGFAAAAIAQDPLAGSVQRDLERLGIVDRYEPPPIDKSEFEQYLPARLRGGEPAKPRFVPPTLPVTLYDRISGGGKALALYNEAVALALEGRGLLAIEKYGKAIEANPKLPEARYGIGIELGRLGHFDQAKIQFEEACKLRPGYVEASKFLTRANSAIASRFER
jgi:tetratricopeptide (TPR) repeat protein